MTVESVENPLDFDVVHSEEDKNGFFGNNELLAVPFSTILHMKSKDFNLVLGTFGSSFLIYEFETLKIIYTTNDVDQIKEKKLKIEESPTSLILDAAFCPETNCFALVTDDKKILMYKLLGKSGSCELAFCIFASKKPTCVRFTLSGEQLLIANKYGDVFEYDANPTHYDPTPTTLLPPPKSTLIDDVPILGHVSIILDMELAKPDASRTVVITSDHDEHIRVSRYPRSDVIHGFCLGHTGIVSKIHTAKFLPKLLISASSDGTIKFWDYMTCKELQTISYQELMSEKLSVKEDLQRPSAPFFLETFPISSSTYGLLLGLEKFSYLGFFTFDYIEGSLSNCALKQLIALSESTTLEKVVTYDQEAEPTFLGAKIYAVKLETKVRISDFPTALALSTNKHGRLVIAAAQAKVELTTITEQVMRKTEKLQKRTRDSMSVKEVFINNFEYDANGNWKNVLSEFDCGEIINASTKQQCSTLNGFQLFKNTAIIKAHHCNFEKEI